MKICKKTVLTAICICLSAFIWAQSEDMEEISLPDVSTVISGGAPKVGKSAISDFTDVLPSADEKIENIIPQLPESSEAGILNSDAVVTVSPEKTIYVEGLAGGGYPGYITGNFKIYRQSGDSPFKVEFGHDSANGYSGRSLTSAYSDRETFINAEKLFQTKKAKLSLSAYFESDDDGLQNQYENISEVTKENLGAALDWFLLLDHGFAFGVKTDGNWYKRYATVTGTPLVDISSYAKNIAFFDFEPEMYFTWENKGFSLKFDALYTLSTDLKDALYGYKSTSRGDFGLNLSWKNDLVNLYASVDAVLGNHIGDNEVILPFTLGIDFGFASALSSRKITMGLEGGCDSYLAKVNELEKRYRFSALSVMPLETSDFYGKASVALPIKDRFTLTVDGEVRKTAYDNGLLQPDYDTDVTLSSIFGQYLYTREDMTQFNTDINFAVRIGLANISADWKSYWIDRPSDAVSQFVSGNISVQNKKSTYGFDGSMGFCLDPKEDNTPEVDLSVFWRLTPAVRLAVSANDVVKLITGEERDYAGEYISRSGTAAVLVKFFF